MLACSELPLLHVKAIWLLAAVENGCLGWAMVLKEACHGRGGGRHVILVVSMMEKVVCLLCAQIAPS